jgi:hypothetical protein
VPPLQAKAAVAPSAVIRKVATAQMKSGARERLVRWLDRILVSVCGIDW